MKSKLYTVHIYSTRKYTVYIYIYILHVDVCYSVNIRNYIYNSQMGCLKIRLLSKYRSVCTTFLCLLDLICEHHQPSPNPPNHPGPRKNPGKPSIHSLTITSTLSFKSTSSAKTSTTSSVDASQTSWMARQIAEEDSQIPWEMRFCIWKQGAISSQQETSRLQSFKSTSFFFRC